MLFFPVKIKKVALHYQYHSFFSIKLCMELSI